MKRKLSISEVKDVVSEVYNSVKDIKGGKNADYIPFLANVPSNLFGVSVTLPSGEIFDIGDTSYHFGIESVSKVLTAILVMKQHGTSEVLDKIGADATGLPFNSVMAILLENDHPSTPLVNAGAISACSMVSPAGDSDGKWGVITDFFADIMGDKPILLDELYKSESDTNFNNKAISWLLKNYGRIYDDPNIALDIYTRQCSLGVTARQLSVCAATIANFGVNPVTGKTVFDSSVTPKIVSMIATVGFYERTGDWMYTTGIPSKTGVGGGVMGVIPHTIGISAFSPPIDTYGNSIKAQQAIKDIVSKLGLNIYG